MKAIYAGRRDKAGTCHVHVIRAGDSYLLDPRFDLFNHSPTGFEWGYGGSGPSQLALALLADALRNDVLAVRMHQDYKWAVVGKLQRDQQWKLSQTDVRLTAANLALRHLGLMLLQIDETVEGICSDCGFHLLDRGMVRKDVDGTLVLVEGCDFATIAAAAEAHHGAAQ